ncbi:crotonase/enoyl-CoA hydratase family protein [Gephyromycinifex aptenodytis]|uniref:crotonase/enoyl-CoA hydratase family protein n=1 Tax=Gephyromycinifex aptenodytis TaxID=2716227 RepID=UPI0014460D70|nr:crotonase/enoyl-CoA hydratase family protein [Gephyromycinifex aptenodytis]
MSPSAAPLRIERDKHVQTWTLDLPEQRNPISGEEMIAAIEQAAQEASADLSVRVVILTGAGSTFCAGGNVKDMADRVGMFGGSPAQIRQGYRNGIQRIPLALQRCEVPIIAAVNGPAVGAGCDLACMCDLRIASRDAWFAESFVKLALIPGDGGAWFLPRAVGAARAAEMALTGDRIDAATALEWGLVSRVVEPSQLLSSAQELALRIARNPPGAVRMTKQLLREAQHARLESVLEMSAALQALAHHSDNHAEALAAAMERREADFDHS